MQHKDIVVSVKGIYKTFKLPHEQHSGVKQLLLNIFKSKKGYKKQRVLEDISFEIEKGEFFGIVGRNGSGKSTLLKLLAGIYSPDKGLMEVKGSLTPFIELGVGFNPELTGRENVYLNGALLGFGRHDMDSMYDDIVTFAELDRFMDQKLKNYSSGMQVRLAFSIAIRAQSDVLLLDEVLAVGDAAFQRKCFDYFKELKRAKRTVIFISHDMNAVREYCDRAVLIDSGKVIAEGDADTIALKYTKLFLKQPERSTSSNASDNSDRWGSGEVYIESMSYRIDNDQIEVSVNIAFKKSVENPIFGFSIKNPFGAKIIENNTKWADIETGSFSKGSTAKAVWRFPNILTNGRNYVTIALCNQDASEYYDWYEDALIIEVDKPLVTTALTLPGDSIRVVKKGK